MNCAARDCEKHIPPKTQTGGAPKRYCSDTCRRRERDRRLHGFGTRTEQRQRIAQREAKTMARMLHRQRVRVLGAMLRQIDVLAKRVDAPCDCDPCRAQRARLDLRGRRLQRMAANKALIKTLKGTDCSECGLDYQPEELHFHHIDPQDKLFNMSQARAGGYTEQQIRAEAAKCEVLCANCHRDRHTDGVREGRVAA